MTEILKDGVGLRLFWINNYATKKGNFTMTLTSEQILQQVRAHQNGVGLNTDGVGLNTDGVGLNNNGVGLTQHGVGLTDLIEKRAQNGVGLSENTMENSENTMQNTEKTKNLPQNGVGY